MSNLVKINGDTIVGLPVTLADGSQFIIPAVSLADSSGAAIGAGLTDAQLRASAVPVSATALGAIADAAYTDVTGAASGSIVALLKGCFVKLAVIATNTTP